mgnify:CR=1 FL=1
MAKSNKQSETKVTRIRASETTSANAPKAKPANSGNAAKKSAASAASDRPTKNPFVRIGRYFKGAWQELRQVRWPDRKNTWAMTGALLAFTAFFIVIILFLDFLFSELFKLIMGSN